MGAWGPWERVEAGSGEAGRGAEKNVEVNKNQLKKEKKKDFSHNVGLDAITVVARRNVEHFLGNILQDILTVKVHFYAVE